MSVLSPSKASPPTTDTQQVCYITKNMKLLTMENSLSFKRFCFCNKQFPVVYI